MMINYVAFLRGINVGGHHKVPMQDLRDLLINMGFHRVDTVLNTGNVLFESTISDSTILEEKMAEQLQATFGFAIPVTIRTAEQIQQLLKTDPFQNISLTKDIRWYVSFLYTPTQIALKIPWSTPDNAYTIIAQTDRMVLSVLDVSITKTPKGMEVLEQHFGKEMTTRNWNTIQRIGKKLNTKK